MRLSLRHASHALRKPAREEELVDTTEGSVREEEEGEQEEEEEEEEASSNSMIYVTHSKEVSVRTLRLGRLRTTGEH